MKAVIWHNPRCSKSRAALALLEEAGADVAIVDYVRTPPPRVEIAAMVAAAGLAPGAALRPQAKAALDGAEDGTILDAMAADPAIIERPFVGTEKGVRLCRPPERVREIL